MGVICVQGLHLAPPLMRVPSGPTWRTPQLHKGRGNDHQASIMQSLHPPGLVWLTITTMSPADWVSQGG